MCVFIMLCLLEVFIYPLVFARVLMRKHKREFVKQLRNLHPFSVSLS